MKKILVVDDSALMRRVLCDIINADERFEVADRAKDGLEAFDFLSRNQYDAVVMDVNMPRMTGLQVLQELRKFKIPAKVMMASTDTVDGAKVTLEALELGALDFVQKPENALNIREDNFKEHFLQTLYAVTNSKAPEYKGGNDAKQNTSETQQKGMIFLNASAFVGGRKQKVVAIASSTGGPKALQAVVSKLPEDLSAPVVIVQHMPKGFTASLADRLNSLSSMKVVEAKEGDVLENGTIYVAAGGLHLKVINEKGRHVIKYSDEPLREGVKPCANYMYESLMDSGYDKVICVVLTGMGADGTQGIKNLKTKKSTYVIAQTQETCVVYGMPKSVTASGLSDEEVPLEEIAQEIIMNVGVK